MSGDPFALYVHVPYCRRVCPYCDFNVHAAAEPPERAYVAGVLAELATHAARAPWEGRRLRSIYVGGGTPSLFSPAAIAELLDAIVGRFGLTPGAEVTLEANPGTVSPATLAGYRAAGVNRLSLGAQSFAAAHLHTLGRDHGPDETSAAMAAARAAGFGNVSLDLIFGVPGQDLASWEGDLTAAIALAPEHVSAYALTYEPGTPFFAARGSGRLTPADDDLEADMAERTLVLLPAAGYARYEISSYARPGFASRHNASYWNGSEYLGLGAGAHSFARTPAPGRRWVNERVPARYLEAVAANGSAVGSEERLSEAQARGEFCLTGLRQTVGVDVEAFRQRFGEDLRAAFPHIDRLVADGLLELGSAHLRLTPDGFRHADSVAATFV
jgi:oxygen-independent coproporphyrinogen-3 oxidase